MRPFLTFALCATAFAAKPPLVKTAEGRVEGTESSGIRLFRGIPFAAPPTGPLRWREPQPVSAWKGRRAATAFGPRCAQLPLFSDMVFRSNGVSEDCLYLNVWAPTGAKRESLPVLVYFYGGGFMAGDGSEPRYDGESMARKGMVAVTVNYRLGVFGFLAHPELTKESPHRASGNYGLLDQSAALRWVKRNIAAFGGDPRRVTIAGESAGSVSVSAQMASPLSRDLIAGAIGESGSLLGTLAAVPLAEAEKGGEKFAQGVGAASLADLRARSTEQLLDAVRRPGAGRFPVTVDGYFLTEDPVQTFANGRQARVPLLAGWNSEEAGARAVLGRDEPTAENFQKALERLYGAQANAVREAYAGEPKQAATDLAGDRFIGFSTWRWAKLCARTGGKPVYRYYYTQPRPGAAGASHSAEIEYAMGNLDGNKVYAWTAEDREVSRVMQEYFANFIKQGNPNGSGLPEWPALNEQGSGSEMVIGVRCAARAEPHRHRYLLLEKLAGN